MKDGCSVRDQILRDLVHVFSVVLRVYRPMKALQLPSNTLQTPGPANGCACKPDAMAGNGGSCDSMLLLRLGKLPLDVQVLYTSL